MAARIFTARTKDISFLSSFKHRHVSTSIVGSQQAKEEPAGSHDSQLRLPPCQMPNMLDIGSRTIFDEDRDIFRSSVRRFMRDELYPAHKRFEAQGHVDREVWNRLGEQGYLGVAISDEVGGIGGTFKDEAIVLEEQSYAHCHAPAIT